MVFNAARDNWSEDCATNRNTSGSHGKVLELLDALARLVADGDDLRVMRVEREVHRFGDGSAGDTAVLDGAAFSPSPGATAPWIPAEWQAAMAADPLDEEED